MKFYPIHKDLAIQNIIREECKKVINQSNKIFGHWTIDLPPLNYKSINIKFDLKGDEMAGSAKYAPVMILRFNLDLARKNLNVYLRDTVPHEIAHLYQHHHYTNTEGHDDIWTEIILDMGYIPNVNHNYKL